jgi:hypothetical protein
MMEKAVSTSETSVNFHQRNIPEDSYLQLFISNYIYPHYMFWLFSAIFSSAGRRKQTEIQLMRIKNTVGGNQERNVTAQKQKQICK